MVCGLEKVVWTEGIVLSQQHFQCWDQYWQQHSLVGRLPDFYGIKSVVFDACELQRGVFKILSCEVIFPDGRCIVFQDQVDASLSCPLEGEVGYVFLAIPDNQSISGVPGCVESDQASWQAVSRPCVDQYNADQQRDVVLARSLLEVYAAPSPKKNWISLSIARFVYKKDVGYVNDETFIPVACCMAAAPALHRLLQGLASRLGEWLAMIRQGRDVYYCERAGVHVLMNDLKYEMARFCSRAYFSVDNKHFFRPIHAFNVLFEFFYQLKAFVNDDVEGDWSYSHDAINKSFSRLVKVIERIISKIQVAKYQKIPLIRQKECYCFSINYKNIKVTKVVLLVNNHHSGVVDRGNVSQHIKISRKEDMGGLVSSSLSGFSLKHMRVVPNYFVLQDYLMYFEICMDNKTIGHAEGGQNFLIYLSSLAKDVVLNVLVLEEDE